MRDVRGRSILTVGTFGRVENILDQHDRRRQALANRSLDDPYVAMEIKDATLAFKQVAGERQAFQAVEARSDV